jgi:hypothetical protein
MNLSNEVYDRLKFLVQVVLPGVAALYVGLAAFWPLPEPTAVAGSIALLAVFLGLFLNRSAAKYEGQGDLVITTDMVDGDVSLQLDPNENPAAFKNKKNVTFNVRRQDIPA